MKLNLKRIVLLVVILSLMLIGSGCESKIQPISDRVLTILQGVDATTLDPAMHSDSPTGNIEMQIFDTLLNRNEEMKIVESVASSWKMISNTIWEFRLRKDIVFHNGDRLTAADVKFSIDRILDPENKSARISYYKSIKKVEVVNEHLIRIITKEPNPVLLTRLAELRIVPKDYVNEIGNQEFSVKPIGSGPYILKNWVKDEYVSLTANESYWNGPPAIKKVIFRPVPEASARVMSLQAREADIITNLPAHLAHQVTGGDNTDVAKVDSTRFIMLAITTSRPVVSDVRVRKALNYAVDIDTIIEELLGGNAIVGTQPVCSFDLGYNKNLNPYGYNPELARQLLAEAGYGEGLKLVMRSPSGRYLMDKEVAQAIKAQLAKVGVEAELSFEEWGSYVTSIINGSIDADIWLIGWGSATFDAGTTLSQWLHTEQPVSQYDVSAEKNNWVDKAIEKALSTMNDEERAALYQQIIEETQQDIPFVNLYQQEDLYGVSKRVNWKPRSDETILLHDASWK